MNHSTCSRINLWLGLAALACAGLVAGCGSGRRERAGQMTSFSSKESKEATPELLTIPPDQMAHVQVVTIEPGS